MKYLTIVPDGMSDHPQKELSNQTPLEAASTPNMDYLAENGEVGLAKTFFKGLPYDSSIANMSILGFDPRKYYSGRAPLEALNLGIELSQGDVAIRCNLVTLKDNTISDFTAGHITNEEGEKLIQSLNKELSDDSFEFYPGVSYRNILLIRGAKKPSTSIDAKFPHNIIGENIAGNWVKANDPGAKETSDLMNQLIRDSWEILEKHPVNLKRADEGKHKANSIWLWGAGTKPCMPSFEKLFHIKGSLVSAVDLLNGLGKAVGLEVLNVDGVTGYIDTNYEGKADASLDSLDRNEFAYIHLESPDETGHEGSIEKKIKSIEDIDKRVVGRIIDNIDYDFRLCLLPDHATPVDIRKHTDEPVPYILYDSLVSSSSKISGYSEKNVNDYAGNKIINAFELVPKMLKAP